MTEMDGLDPDKLADVVVEAMKVAIEGALGPVNERQRLLEARVAELEAKDQTKTIGEVFRKTLQLGEEGEQLT